MKKTLLFAAFLGAAAALHATPVLDEAAPVPVKRLAVPYTVAPLDQVTVTRPGHGTETYKISQEGTIALGDGEVKVAGLDSGAARALLARRLGKDAVVRIVEFRSARVTVLGEVFHQIYADMGEGPMRVLDAVAAANGFTSLANTRRVKLVRENAGDVEIYELDLRQYLKGNQSSQNMLVQPGDVITVPRNFL